MTRSHVSTHVRMSSTAGNRDVIDRPLDSLTLSMRLYSPEDKCDVLEMCKTVCTSLVRLASLGLHLPGNQWFISSCADDGKDYIPRTIDGYHQMDDVDLYVCDYDEDENMERKCVSLLCGTRDGSTYRVWGARTHPAYRGQGVMKYMMKEMYTRVAVGDFQHIVSTTISENKTMLSIFSNLGYTEHAIVYGWPDSRHANYIDRIIKEYGENGDHAHAYRWEVCCNKDVLCDALSSVRGQREDFDRVWIPGSYETVSADGITIGNMMEQRRVHIVYNEASAPLAVVASMEDQLNQQILSIVHDARNSRTEDILRGYCSAVSTKNAIKNIKRIYMDTCGVAIPTDPGSSLTKGLFDYIVLRQTI